MLDMQHAPKLGFLRPYPDLSMDIGHCMRAEDRNYEGELAGLLLVVRGKLAQLGVDHTGFREGLLMTSACEIGVRHTLCAERGQDAKEHGDRGGFGERHG
jgi:hypothetical protein